MDNFESSVSKISTLVNITPRLFYIYISRIALRPLLWIVFLFVICVSLDGWMDGRRIGGNGWWDGWISLIM
jgi:hypothetical protein